MIHSSRWRLTKFPVRLSPKTAGLLSTKVDEGQEVKIGEIVAVIEDSAAAPGKNTEASAEAKPDTSAPQRRNLRRSDRQTPMCFRRQSRRIMEEEQIDPQKMSGTGKGGRLTKGDVVGYGDSESKGFRRRARKTVAGVCEASHRSLQPRAIALLEKKCRHSVARSRRSWSWRNTPPPFSPPLTNAT